MELCSYGCGQEATHQLKNGKWCCSKSQKQCPQIRNKHRGKRPKEIGLKISKAIKGRAPWNKGRTNIYSEEVLSKMKNSQLGKRKGPQSLIHRKKLGESKVGNKNPAKRPDVKKKISNTVKKLWDDKNSSYHTEEYWIKRYIGENRKPNNAEKIVTSLLDELFINSYEYVGNFKVWINEKNPDWIHIKDKKVIEYFGGHWHDKEITGEDRYEHERNRVKAFEEDGYKALVVWEEELKDIESLKKKLINFETERMG